MRKGCHSNALIVFAFILIFCVAGFFDEPKQVFGEPILRDGIYGEIQSTKRSFLYSGMLHWGMPLHAIITASEEAAEEIEAKNTVTQMTMEPTKITDLTDAFDVILRGATKEFIAGYVIDHSFLMWLNAQYGDDVIQETAQYILDNDMDVNNWYTLTGNSIHVLWLLYCRDTGFQNYQLNDVYWQECRSTEETVISFAGDFNFAEGWCTTEFLEQQPNGIYDCFSPNLLEQMNTSDILVLNNEFTYSDRGTALAGKSYTFRAKPETVGLLSIFGADIVTLANNHVFDYEETGLMDTIEYLKRENIPYSGAGSNEEEASRIVYFVANGKKIAIVSATEIERSVKYTREATETESGVLKTLNPDKFLRVIEKAEKSSDYVIAVVHWGTEGSLSSDSSQKRLAERFAAAGADAIIGDHPHRLQGAAFIGEVPVAYSLGNFWFSDGTLYTTLAQIAISADGKLQLRYLPCVQKDLKTSLISDETEKEGFYHYLASISEKTGIDEEGNVYHKGAEDYPEEKIRYDSDSSTTRIRGMVDNEGHAIDIVGNRK